METAGLIALGIVLLGWIVIICVARSKSPMVQRNIRKFEARPDKTFMEQVREEYRQRRADKKDESLR